MNAEIAGQTLDAAGVTVHHTQDIPGSQLGDICLWLQETLGETDRAVKILEQHPDVVRVTVSDASEAILYVVVRRRPGRG